MRRTPRVRALWRPRDVAVLALTSAATIVFLGLAQGFDPQVRLHAQQIVPPPAIAGDLKEIPNQTGVMAAPQVVASAFMTTAESLTPEQLDVSRLGVDRLSSTWAGRLAGVIPANEAAGPLAGTEVVPREIASGPAASSAGPGAAAGILPRVMPLAPSTFGLAVRMVAEPSLAVGDSVMWMTGNWFAARSTDEGASWTYVNPYADFPTFTSDQDAVYDPHRHLFAWYRQGGQLPGRSENSFRLSVSTDRAASWCSYTLRPSEVDPAWNTFNFDYPHLAVSDHYLYVSSTLAVTGAGFASPRMILFRMPLDDLAGCAAFRYTYWTSDEGWSWTPVENGATTTMYLGDTLEAGGGAPTGIFRVYVQPESSSALYYADRSVPAWTFTERTGRCPVAGGGNPCARTDGRVTSGWVRQQNGRGEVGFLWNVREGGGFPNPYIDAVTFDLEALAVTGRPLLWDSRCAWQYGAAAPEGEGLGIAAFYFCPSQPPAHAIGLADGAAGQLKWTMAYSQKGEVPTSTVVWGDYIRVRADARGYFATGYTIGENGAEPFVVSFGRNPLVRSDDDLQPPGDNPRH
jgi:hypothetical protein